MKERRIARRCKNCGESTPNDALLCAACGKAMSEIYTRLSDPDKLRAPRFGPRKIPERKG